MRLNNNSGIILIVVLWVLVILSILAIGLSRRASVELTLTKYSIGQMKSKYLAMAGMVYAMDMIRKDTAHEEGGTLDTKVFCGFHLEEDRTIEDVFKNVRLGGGYFDIRYMREDSSGIREKKYGFRDEESKININAISANDFKVLSQLITQSGQSEDAADALANAIIQWRDKEDALLEEIFAEEADYTVPGSARYSRHKSFGSLEEVLLVEGMSEDIFQFIKKYISIFPKSGSFLVNIDTAEKPVLLSFARRFSEGQAAVSDADSLVEKILSFRQGDDGIEATHDDRQINASEMNLSAKEQSILSQIEQKRTKVSRYLHVTVKGVDETSLISSTIEAIVYRDDLSIVYWHRNY